MSHETVLPGLPGSSWTYNKSNANSIPLSNRITTQHKLSDDEYGIILQSPISVEPYSYVGDLIQRYEYTQAAYPQADELIRSVLLWDRIHLPEEEVPFYKNNDFVSTLIQEGIALPLLSYKDSSFLDNLKYVDRFNLGDDNSVNIQNMIQKRLRIFTELESDHPGRWAMGRGPQSPLIPEAEEAPGRGLLINLQNILPLPAGDVPIDDVLAFRLKRRDELLNLRSHLIDLFSRISSPDIDNMVRKDLLQKFERDVNGYVKSLKESKLKSFGIDLIAKSNTAAAAITAGTALGSGATFVNALLSGAGAALTIEACGGLKKSHSTNPYEVIGKYYNNLPWQFA
jgi:hypothetical protein